MGRAWYSTYVRDEKCVNISSQRELNSLLIHDIPQNCRILHILV